ncbi:MAG: hypothetical protein ACO3UX_13115, partial [Candidatus Nanopelagicales bacterium]
MSPRIVLSLALTASVAAGLAGGVSTAQAVDPPSPECAWWVETSMSTTNVLYPDTAAAYWTMP